MAKAVSKKKQAEIEGSAELRRPTPPPERLTLPTLPSPLARAMTAIASRLCSRPFEMFGQKFQLAFELRANRLAVNDQSPPVQKSLSMTLGDALLRVDLLEIPYPMADLRRAIGPFSEALPEEVRLAMLEVSLRDLAETAAFAGLGSLRWKILAERESAPDSVWGTLSILDGPVQRVIGRLSASPDSTVKFAAYLNQIPPKRNDVSALPASLTVELVRFPLALATIRNIRSGDILILGPAPPDEIFQTRLWIGNIVFSALLGAQFLKIKDRVSMSEPKAAAGDNLSPTELENLALDVQCVLCETRLTVAEISALTSGSIIDLKEDVSRSVQLRVNDQTIAIGELVRIGASIGISVTHVALKPPPPPPEPVGDSE